MSGADNAPMNSDDVDREHKGGLFKERIGPLYTVASTARLLNRTEVEVRADIRHRILLAIELADRVLALPERQFDENRLPLPGLPEVSAALDPEGTDPLAIALLLFTTADHWGGGTAAEFMRAGRLEEVVSAADRVHRSLTVP